MFVLQQKFQKHKFDEKLKEQFFNTYKFSIHSNNRFLLLLRKVFIILNIWMIGKNSVKHYYLKKKILQSLKYEDITDADYVHAK